jgi:hypothetical protein
MNNPHTQLASDLLDATPNKYQLTLDVSVTGKRLMETLRQKKKDDPFALETYDADDKVIYQALIMEASKIDDLGDGLIG